MGVRRREQWAGWGGRRALWRLGALAALVTAVVTVPGLAGAAEERAGGVPNLVQLQYGESYGDSGPNYRLYAFGERIETLTFRTSYRGDRASGPARYNKSITDTDLRGEARHPWVLERRKGGKAVLRLIRHSLDARGVAWVIVRARNGNGDSLKEAVEIVLAECAQEPPIYPVDCEVSA